MDRENSNNIQSQVTSNKNVDLEKEQHICDPTKAVRISRCNYECPDCGKDMSLYMFYYQEALEREQQKG